MDLARDTQQEQAGRRKVPARSNVLRAILATALWQDECLDGGSFKALHFSITRTIPLLPQLLEILFDPDQLLFYVAIEEIRPFDGQA